ncbi:MAG: GNAT family N-acetyltransferase [Acidobacteria bacterium]|nr:GNAT family N-acetyltransferase [Acidobacteriota bacterium]
MGDSRTPVSIVPATAADVPLILDLIRELAEYERMADQVEATAGDLERALFGERPSAEAVIARADGEAVGFALFFHTFSTFVGRRGLYLEDLYVRPASRGRGIGRRLLAHLAALALERGCGRFEWSVLNWNAPAIAAYRRVGAAPMDDWTVYRLAGDSLRALAGEASRE